MECATTRSRSCEPLWPFFSLSLSIVDRPKWQESLHDYVSFAGMALPASWMQTTFGFMQPT